jgi:hypothetical protein
MSITLLRLYLFGLLKGFLMATEVWFRNLHNYVRELAEVGGPFRVVWDRGILVKKHIDALKHAQLYFGENADFRILLVGPQGTAELGPNNGMDNPVGVYPTWEYGEDIDLLEEMISSPVGEDEEACDADVQIDQKPVFGQEHRVVVSKLPNMQLRSSRGFFRVLTELQEEYPEAIIHLHGLYSYKYMFGKGIASVDTEPRTDAANGKVVLPSGHIMAYARTVACPQWVELMGMNVVDLKIPRNRCIFNIRSAKWAGEHFTENIRFKTRGPDNSDPNSPVTSIPTTAATRTRKLLAPRPGDKITCDDCSLASSCKYWREGAVCTMPGSETNSLAKYFQSRDSDRIIDALGTVLSAQAKRLQQGMEDEDEYGELSPEVTKIMNQLFSNGVKLAKLVNPNLTKPLVQINNGSAAAVSGSNPQQLMAAVVRAIEDTGVKREDITPQMVENMLSKMTGQPLQIQEK